MDKRLAWKLPEYLETHNLTRYQLMTELGDGKGRIAYEWRKLPKRLDTEALERVLNALEKLTGDRVELSDLLEYTPAPAPIDAETKAWLEANASRLSDYDPYEWEEGELEEGEPVSLGRG
jgi:hypothetical protein